MIVGQVISAQVNCVTYLFY